MFGRKEGEGVCGGHLVRLAVLTQKFRFLLCNIKLYYTTIIIQILLQGVL